MRKGYFSYIRVSTARQGQSGTSLTEQREAIQRYADRWRIRIVQEFEERETAAKSGRPLFLQMLSALKHGKAEGVIIHKIDRSARNLRDWAALAEIIDRGIDVHFANENLDLESRGGRLSADIQAVVAADYIRNLREEVKKGFYGRLKQGFYPLPAPIGYLDRGAATPKDPDPLRAPLIRLAFELYASGRFSINTLVEEMYARGLRTRSNKKVVRNTMYDLLRNPFYIGLMKVGSGNELFVGQHRPIISKVLFERVQLVRRGRNIKKTKCHDFLYRGMIKCGACPRTLTGETQKGIVYYRCHNRTCDQKTVRQDIVDYAVISTLRTLRFNEAEKKYLSKTLSLQAKQFVELERVNRITLRTRLDQLRSRISKLTDGYMDGVVDNKTYVEKKNELMQEELGIKEELANNEETGGSFLDEVEQMFELANQAYLTYELANNDEKREMVRSVSSNFVVRDKNVLIKLKSPFEIISNRARVSNGGPIRDRVRTLSALVKELLRYHRSRKTQDVEEESYEPIKITPGRLKLAFRRANGVSSERLAA